MVRLPSLNTTNGLVITLFALVVVASFFSRSTFSLSCPLLVEQVTPSSVYIFNVRSETKSEYHFIPPLTVKNPHLQI